MSSYILNKKSLSTSSLRKDALKIIEKAYEAIDVEKLVNERFIVKKGILMVSDLATKEHFHLEDFERIFVIGFGKGSFTAVSKMAEILGEWLYGAISLDVEASWKPKKPNKKINAYWGTHPSPSRINVDATSTIVSIARDLGEKDLVIYFVGGGGSSLLCGSLGELECASTLFKELTKKGATIEEINTVRKHVSEVKGGNLAKFTYPATSISLIVSDVCGNPLGVIASGPTVCDKTTIEDAIGTLKKYGISIDNVTFIETPKDKYYFDRCKYFLLACNEDAAIAMVNEARKFGYRASIGSLVLKGEAKKAILPFVEKVKSKEVIVIAGETTVKIIGKGKGGRNQEMCLSVLDAAKNKKLDISGILASSFASDGFDNTPVAGAVADSQTLEKAAKLNLETGRYLSENDSYSFFQKTGDFVCVERKSFNVADLMLVIRKGL
jgi:glycerate-2-kinase